MLSCVFDDQRLCSQSFCISPDLYQFSNKVVDLGVEISQIQGCELRTLGDFKTIGKDNLVKIQILVLASEHTHHLQRECI